MYALKIVLLFLVLVSCQKSPLTMENLKNDLMTSKSITFNNRYINTDNIKKPLNTKVFLLSTNNYCLFYKTPFAKRKSPLEMTKRIGKKCDKKNPVALFKDVKTLSLKLKKKGHGDDIGVLKIFFDWDIISIPLLNVSFKKDFEQYSNHLDSSLIPGLLYGNDINTKFLKDGISCHAVNSDCISVVKNECDKCKNGHFEIVDYNCPQGGSKYCGTSDCGGRNQPACPRGYQSIGSKMRSLCFDGSPAGLCRPGLRTSCNSKNILVCI